MKEANTYVGCINMRCLCECMRRIFTQSGSKFAVNFDMSYAVTISKVTATLRPDCVNTVKLRAGARLS